MDDENEMNEFIKQLMDHQEKTTLRSRKRSKTASIGVHDLSTLHPPFVVKAVERSHSFTTLWQ